MSSAILFHCATVFPGGSTAAAGFPGGSAAAAGGVRAGRGRDGEGCHGDDRDMQCSDSHAKPPPSSAVPSTDATGSMFCGPLRSRCSALRRSRRRLEAVKSERALEFRVLGPIEIVHRWHRDAGSARRRSGRCSRCSCSIQERSCRRIGSSSALGGRTHRRPTESSGSTSRSCGGILEPRGGGGCRGQDAGDAPDRLPASDRSGSA